MISESKQHNTISFRITVMGVFVIVAGLTAGIALGLQYYFSCDLAETAAQKTFRSMSENVSQRINLLESNSEKLVDVLGHYYEFETFPDLNQERRLLPLLGVSMEHNPSLYAVYVGYENGDFFELINLESGENVRTSFDAAPHDRWVLIRIKRVNEKRRKTTVYLDPAFNVRVERQEDADYDPRTRPWFLKSLASPKIIKTAPYFFSNLKAPGVTYAKCMDGGQRVIAVDMSLSRLSFFLQKQWFLPQSQTFLFDRKGNIIARASQEKAVAQRERSAAIDLTEDEKAFVRENPVIKSSNEMDWPPFDFVLSGKPKGYSVDMLDVLAEKCGFQVEYVNGYSWQELVALFKKGDLDLMHSLLKNPEREKWGVFTNQYKPMPQAFAVKKGSLMPSSLNDLKGMTVAIPEGWATDTFLAGKYPGVKRLKVAAPIDALRAVSAGDADATLDSEPVLRYLVDSYFFDDLRIGGHLAELESPGDQGLCFLVRPEKKILATILNKALAAITPEERARLDGKWFAKGNGLAMDSASENTVPHPLLLEIATSAGPEGDLRPMTIKGRDYFGYAARVETDYSSDKFLGLLVPVEEIIRPYMAKVLLSLIITVCTLLFLIPVVWYCATIIIKPINALALESEKVRQRRYEKVGLVKSNITEIFGLSRSMVSMASAIKDYEDSLRELMDSFIKLIASAIDQKSPYTGGHCARVPVLSIMLAEAANDSTDKPFDDFSFKTEEEWHEFRTAAWLHDCGKVTTPEYIVNKATKLETIYNRIHEIRMRFEVLLRDAEIEYWQGLARGKDETALKQALGAKHHEIKEDFAFIAQCNTGGEFMAEEQVDRVKTIARKKWVRHLDNRLGLGHLELLRYPEKDQTLPCSEPLLADRPEHIIKRNQGNSLIQNSSWCRMDVPEHLYNLGEIYNLSISRGTLTDEDRFKINEHIIMTIHMLKTLPYPEHMKRIPEYAGSHHETLIGTGYPSKLTARDIGTPGRIMAIADIFEALTASDRPYKKAKTLNESIKILSFMVKDNHLDADLFKLFLESGVYLAYAKEFLDPGQIDDVKVDDYIKEL